LLHTGLLSYHISFLPELIPLSRKTTCLPSCSLYTSLEFLEVFAPTTIPVTPTHHIARFLTVPTFFFNYFSQPSAPLPYDFRVNSFPLGIGLYIFPSHVPSTFPPHFAFRSVDVFGFGHSDADVVGSWGSLASLRVIPTLPLLRTSAVPFVRIRIFSSSFRLFCRRATIGPISPFYELVV